MAFAAGAPPALRAAALSAAGAEVIEEYPRSGVLRLRVPPDRLSEAQRALLESGAVRFAEPNARLRVAQIVPDDPHYLTEQAWYFDLMGASEAWSVTTGSRAVVVALLDGAVDLDHPDLAANIWTNPGEIAGNGIDDDGNGYVDDVHGFDFIGDYQGGPGVPGRDASPDAAPGDPALGDGLDQDGDGKPDGAVGHGTKVAGIIAAVGNNRIGVAGTAWRVTVMPLRVTTPEGDGFFSALIAGLEYAVANGADVVNISLASRVLPQAAAVAVQAAAEAGVIMVAAAGNTGRSVSFPAALLEVIAVGTHGGPTAPDERALFSPWGPEMEFVAPAGTGVYSTDVAARTGEATYGVGVGSSFSAPFVTGLVALIRALDPTATLETVRGYLQAGAVDLPDGNAPNWDGGARGGGRIHLAGTVAAVIEAGPHAPAVTAARVGPASVVVEGVAPPGSAVRVSLEEGSVVGGATADADGRFSAAIPLAQFAEAAVSVRLVATSEGQAGPSPPSQAIALTLPKDVALFDGWNLVGWAGPPGPSDLVLADLPPAVQRVFTWTDGVWELAVPGDPRFTIGEIRTGQALWVYHEATASAAWRQMRAPFAPVALQPGWQLTVWTGPSGDATAALASTTADIQALYVWNSLTGRYIRYRGTDPETATLTELAHFQAVWVLVGERGGLWPAPE